MAQGEKRENISVKPETFHLINVKGIHFSFSGDQKTNFRPRSFTILQQNCKYSVRKPEEITSRCCCCCCCCFWRCFVAPASGAKREPTQKPAQTLGSFGTNQNQSFPRIPQQQQQLPFNVLFWIQLRFQSPSLYF